MFLEIQITDQFGKNSCELATKLEIEDPRNRKINFEQLNFR